MDWSDCKARGIRFDPLGLRVRKNLVVMRQLHNARGTLGVDTVDPKGDQPMRLVA